jgi:Protein of unknown function (DUF2281)
MKEQKIWRDFDALPPELQQQVADFISFLRTRYAPSQPNKTTKRTRLAKEPFIGMWRNRDDMRDSTAWVRNTREREWMNRNA